MAEKFVRVIVKATGAEMSAPLVWIESEPHLYEVLEGRDAVDASGVPLPSKPRVSKGDANKTAATKAESSQPAKAGSPADNNKE